MASPRYFHALVAALSIMSVSRAGPLGPLPLPNVTSLELGLKEGGCALGDVVYMPGDEFPGESACERCVCGTGGLQCGRQRCQPRPGCKALHRPDHCCPTYQCECEQEGRVYGNGEKLVDPADPCRVCYCQGGEVVCRRIACFVRDDCSPRRVPGRCCPEYDNCPLRGVTTIAGTAPSISNIPAFEDINTSAVPSTAKETIKQEITIKEITPVSEIPVMTEVKIKEIPPSSDIEAAEYSSSKSPLTPREVTSESSQLNKSDSKLETPDLSSGESSSSSDSSLATESSKSISENDNVPKITNEALPSKISFSTQDSINNNIYASSVPSAMATVGSPSMVPNVVSVPSSKAPSMIEDEDSSLFDHNPAFPPLPDDLSVLGNHEEEIFTEQNMDTDHLSGGHVVVIMASTSVTPTEAVVTREAPTTTPLWENSREISFDDSTTNSDDSVTIVTSKSKESSLPNLRSVMSTELFNVPYHIGMSVEMSDATDAPVITSSTAAPYNIDDENSAISKSHSVDSISISTDDPYSTELQSSSNVTEFSEHLINVQFSDQTTSSISKSNAGTEVTSQTELSSLPIETSDQNPHDSSENITKDKASISTVNPLVTDGNITKLWPTNSLGTFMSKTVPLEGENQSFENLETTEFVLPSFDSQESVTIGIDFPESEKSSAIIDQTSGSNNKILTDLINLVGDVAAIGDHTDGSEVALLTARPTTISDSEELLPVNTGHKSKNKNWNLNSITEVPLKFKSTNRPKIVEIEDDESDSITDSPPPHDRVEPTTRRPIIDNVSDEKPENRTEKKDIEIITQSYVPTINRRPTKVIMKKFNENPTSDESNTSEVTTEVAPSEAATEKNGNFDETTVVTNTEAAAAGV